VGEQEQLNSTQDNYKGITGQYAISFCLDTSCLEQDIIRLQMSLAAPSSEAGSVQISKHPSSTFTMPLSLTANYDSKVKKK
jgi:hypothetical protein